MSLQIKRRRRLVFLLIATLALFALAGGGALWRLHRMKQRAFQGRTEGLASMAHGDYASALVQLGRYLSRYPNDVDCLLPYAKARQLVEEPNGRNLGQAIGLYQRVLELRPGLPEAQRSLLDLYFQVGYNVEAIKLADALLEKTPDDTNALRIKVLSLMRMQRLPEAEAAAQLLTRKDPLNLDFHILEIQIMLDRGEQNKVQDYADRLAKDHLGDPRFQLLRSMAASLSGDPQTAIKLVGPLVTGPQVDAAYTRFLARQLDGLQLFGDAFTVLQQAVKSKPDPETMQLWVRRLFETNRLPMLLEQTAAVDQAPATADAEVLAMRALALLRLDRRPEALQLQAALDQRAQNEPSAAHWASALHAVLQADSSSPIQTMQLLQNALAGNANNPILLEELADAYAAAGENEKAATTWQRVIPLAPAWSAPLVRLSQALVMGGQTADALAAAKAAQLRAPDDHDALMSVIVASAAALPQGASADATKVLALIADFQKRFPKDLGVLPVKAGVLVQTGQQDPAIAVIRTALAARPAAPEQVLLGLAQLSESSHLGQEEACFNAAQEAYGLGPALAFTRARWLLSQKRGPEGLKLLEQARAKHPADDPSWRQIWAAYLDMMDDPRAKAEWMALGNANPKDVKVQWAVLSARAVQSDHPFIGQTIDRLVEMLGEDDLTLRVLRARWLLQGQSADTDTTKASILLSDITRNAPNVVAPHLLLATCYMRLGNTSGAIDQLAAASDLQPQRADIAIELAQLLQARGDFTRATQYITRATGSKLATVGNMRQAASLMALQGDYSGALALLNKTSAHAADQPPDLLVAALYRQLNQPQKTAEICRQLLEKPDAAAIAFSADFYASQDRMPEAQHALALLDTLKLPAGQKELILASFAVRHGSAEEALKQYQAAVQAAPKEAAAWQQLVAYCLATGKVDQALAAADQAAQKLASPAAFDTLRQNAALIKDAAAIPATRDLVTALAGTGPADAPVLDALRIVVAAQKQKAPPQQTALKLRQLSDQNPRLLPLQVITIQFYMTAGQTDEAVNLCTRTVQAFPTAVEPLRLATNVLGAAKQWGQLLGTAKEWRRMATGDSLDPDLAIAAAELNLGDAAAASQQIQPYLERAVLDPDKYGGVILLRAELLLASHQPAQAESLLAPLLPKSAQWRSIWTMLAMRSIADPKLAGTWLERVSPLMVKDINEKTALAMAWIRVGQRGKNGEGAGFEATGRKMIEEIVQSPDALPEAWVEWGKICEAKADWSGAARAYRQAVQKAPGNAIALNNLAYALVETHGDLAEAQQLIAKAVAIAPNQPNFLDTQATVQAATKDYNGAVASLQHAQRVDPNNIMWHINLLAVLVDAGQLPAARTEAQQIMTTLSATPDIAPALRQRFDALRAKLQ